MATTSKKMMITDVFVNGAFQGWNIATHSTIPNVLMAFVIIKMLNISGALDFIGFVMKKLNQEKTIIKGDNKGCSLT